MIKRNKLGQFMKGSSSYNKGKKLTREHKKNLSKSWDYNKHFTEETRRKLSLALKGDKNPMKRPEVRKKISMKLKGHIVSKETREKIGNSNRGKKCSEETRKKMSLSHKGKKLTIEHRKKLSLSKIGDKNPAKSPETRRKMSLTRKGCISPHRGKKYPWVTKRNLNPKEQRKMAIARKIKPNKPEKIMINLIRENNLPFNYVGDGKIWFKGQNHSFNPDFLSKNPKYILEIYGGYWHNLPKAVKRDKERLKTYKKYGYETLVIWESELKNQNQVVNKIKGFMN